MRNVARKFTDRSLHSPRQVLALGLLFTLILVAVLPAFGQTYTERVLHSFTSQDGTDPLAGLVRDAAGNLYGTTFYEGPYGNGTVFRIEPSGTFDVLYAFAGGLDGGSPSCNLVQDANGNLYGTTSQGGAYQGGVAFKVALNGTETVLHSFGNGNDGASPSANLVIDSAGNLYGTTPVGGSHGNGTVFKISSAGNETVLYNFAGGADGWQPLTGLILDQAGDLYGSTNAGGKYGWGTLFKLTATGNHTVVYSFPGGNDGSNPSGVVLDPAGNLYGTASGGKSDDGIVFKVSATGNATILHSFRGGTDGAYPYSGVILDSAGNLYCTTYSGGGSNNGGTVFKVAVSGKESVLYAFPNSADGDAPVAAVIRDSAGNLYGTTKYGGLGGTAFEVSP